MSPQPNNQTEIPAQTVEVARAAFPNGNLYLSLRDEFETMFQDEQFQSLYPLRGQPAETPWRLALVTAKQLLPTQHYASKPLSPAGDTCPTPAGAVETHFQHLVTASTFNSQRMLSWLSAKPRLAAYTSHIAALATA